MSSGIPQKDASIRANRQILIQKVDHDQNEYVTLGKYESPPKIPQEISSVKVQMVNLGKIIGIDDEANDINLDNGHSFCREILFHFSRLHTKQTLESSYIGYDSPNEDNYTLQNYEHLSNLAKKERPNYKVKTRMMEGPIFPSRLYSGDKYSDFLMWKPEIDENAEEIWATIASVAESKLDSLLQNESKWLEINDLEKLEEILDQSIDLYKHLTETPKNTSSSSSLSKQNLTQNIDLTPLDFIANTPPAKTAQDQEKVQENEQIDEKEVELAKRKTDWKHVIKAYLMERLLLQREYKRKIGYAVNYFKSVQRKLTQDSIELGSRHTNSDENIEIKTNNLAAQAQQLKKKQQQLNTLTTAENPASIFHDGSGQPLVYNTENIKTICSKQDDLNEENARKKAWPLLRLHRISQDEIRLIDHNGVYIFLESAIPELEKIMSRLLNCGNYYISQYEGRYGLFGKLKKPVIDRGTVWLDLLKEECGFQYAKLEVIEKLSYIYEHTNDFESMQAVGQLLHNFIDKKPRLQLASEYFIGGYKMEIECMNEYSKLLEKLINMQSLSDSKLSKENTEMINRKKEMYDLEKQKAKINILNNMSGNTNSQIHKTSTNLPNNDKQLYKDPYIGYGGESYRKKLEEILELEPMREQDLFLNHRKMLKSEPQDDELENMFEFISFKEGFDYLIPETSAASKIAYLDESDLPKFGINEFYTSLPEISRILIAIRQGLRSMVEYYQPESGFAISAMEKELIRRASAEYENLQNYALAPPSTIKAEAHSIEANSLCDNPELLIFNLKELYREFNKQNLYDVDPVFIARQSVSTLKEVNFAYFNDPTKILIKPNAENLKWPNLVHFLCNLVEFIRLREFLIDSLFESDKLTEIYKNQQNFVSNSSTILSTADPIIPSKSNKNAWVYPTICNDCKLNFAIKEFDPDLQSILCLHMHKAIKLAVFESGLEEIRAALHYQLMQQQLLQISTLTNFWMYLPYAKAFAELDAVVGGSAISLKQSKRHPFTILNGILGLRIGEDSKVYIREREKIRDKLMRTTAGSFVDLYKAKYLCRGYAQNAWNNFNNKLQPSDTVSKSHDKSIVSQSLEYNSTSIARAQKTFSIYLVHQYCDRVLKMFYTLSIHAHLFAISSSLRFLFRMFPEDELLFDCTKSFGLENVPFSCGLSLGLDEFSLRDGVSTKANFSLNDTLLKIPSTEEIASLIRQFQKEPPVSVQQISYDMNETKPESMIREYLLIGGFQTTKKPKKFLRNDTEPYLYQYDTNSFDLVNGLMLIRNVLTLELGIESTHIPFRLWLQMIKNLKANTLVWRNVQKKGILDNNDNKMNKIEAITREIIEDEHRLSPLEHMLRSVSHRLKVMDCALYKTCGFKVDGVIQYFIIYFKVFF